MGFRGSNGEHQGRDDEGSVIDTDDARERQPGRLRRLWSVLRGQRLDDGLARPGEDAPSLRHPMHPAPVPAPYLAAPRAPVSSTAAPIRHVAQASGGPLVETRPAREVRRLVASLGTTRGEVALALERHGVRSVPHQRGPVATYLEAVIGADPNVKSVVVDAESVVVELRAWWRPSVVVKLPPVVREFTVAFDECCYPRLLADGHGVRADAERAEPERAGE